MRYRRSIVVWLVFGRAAGAGAGIACEGDEAVDVVNDEGGGEGVLGGGVDAADDGVLDFGACAGRGSRGIGSFACSCGVGAVGIWAFWFSSA